MDDGYLCNYSLPEESMRLYASVQMRLALFFLASLATLLAGCHGDQDQPPIVIVLAYDVCVRDIPFLKISSTYSDDFATGVISRTFNSEEVSFDFYLGNFPDTSNVISERELRIDNPSIVSATEQRHSDGHFTVALKLKEIESRRKMLVFRGGEKLTKELDFLLQKVRRCRIDELE